MKLRNIHISLFALAMLMFVSLFDRHTGILTAQQVGMYSHYFYKPMVYNPAFTGTDENPNAMLISRSQWSSFKGSPQLTIFTADGNIMNKKVGLGVSLMDDRKGINNRIGGTVYYAYHLTINDNMKLSFGAALSVADQSIDFSKAQVETASDPTLYADAQHKTAIDANAGIMFSWNDLKIGIGVPQLIANKLKSVNYVDSTNVHAYYTESRHFMISAQYKYMILKDKGLSVDPLFLVRLIPHSPLQFDGTLNVNWQDRLWVGATYKSNYAVSANIGFCLHKQLCVGYSYDIILGNLGKYAGISHEIMVNYKFIQNKKAEPIKQENNKQPEKSYDEQLDKLQAQLKKNQDKLKELNDRLNKQANTPPVVENLGNKPGTVNSDGIFVTSKNDFKDSKGQVAESGYYVIVGIFFYRDFAADEIKNFNKKGFTSSDFIYSEAKKNNYVFVYRVATKEEAFEKEKELNSKDSSNAWILYLTD